LDIARLLVAEFGSNPISERDCVRCLRVRMCVGFRLIIVIVGFPAPTDGADALPSC
jgi:hypothetical protein